MEAEKSKFLESLLDRSVLLRSGVFAVSFVIFELVALPGTRAALGTFVRHFESGDYLRPLIVSALSLIAFLLFVAFVYAACASSYPFRAAYFVIFSVILLTEYGYHKALGGFFRLLEMEVVLYAVNLQLIGDAIVANFSFVALVPILAFGVLLVFSRRAIEKSWLACILIIGLTGSFFVFTSYFTRNTYYVHSFNHALRTTTSFPVIWSIGNYWSPPRSRQYYAKREQVEVRPNHRPRNNIVFVVDESVSSDHMSLNGYPVPTTRVLESLERNGFVRNWDNTVAGTTCSVTANALLLTGLHKLPDTELKTFTLPTLFQYARASNYRNYYFDAQASTFWNGKPSDVADYGNWVRTPELEIAAGKRIDIDAEVAKRVRKIVTGSTGNFIWVTKQGVHQSLLNSYPGAKGPIFEKYDAALEHNSDAFFSELIDRENPARDTYILYTSDHGSSFDEKLGSSNHCTASRSEAKVPLILISAPDQLPDVDTGFKASHSNIFATILDLMDFPQADRKYDYSISLLKAGSADSKKRSFYFGDIHDPNAGKNVPFDVD